VGVYTAINATALKLVTKYGLDVTLNHITYGSEIEADRPDKGYARSTTQYTVKAVTVPTGYPTSRQGFDFGFIPETKITENLRYLVMHMNATGATIGEEDTVVYGGDAYSIAGYNPIAPDDGTPIIWLLGINK